MEKKDKPLPSPAAPLEAGLRNDMDLFEMAIGRLRDERNIAECLAALGRLRAALSPSSTAPSGLEAFDKEVADCVECKSRGDGDYCPEHFHKAKKVAGALDAAPSGVVEASRYLTAATEPLTLESGTVYHEFYHDPEGGIPGAYKANFYLWCIKRALRSLPQAPATPAAAPVEGEAPATGVVEARLRQGLEDIIRISDTAIKEGNPEIFAKIAAKAIKDASLQATPQEAKPCPHLWDERVDGYFDCRFCKATTLDPDGEAGAAPRAGGDA